MSKTFKIAEGYLPKEAFHPGEYLRDELKARGIRQKELAEQLDYAPSALSELIAGKRHISPMLAVRLEAILGISAETWVRLQAQYDLDSYRLNTKPFYPLSHVTSKTHLQIAEPDVSYGSKGKAKKTTPKRKAGA